MRDLSGRLLGFLTLDSFVGYLLGRFVTILISGTVGLLDGTLVGELLGVALGLETG